MTALVVAGATTVDAQYLARPRIPWQAIDTPHFSFYFPSEMRQWTTSIAQQMEYFATSVNSVVGNAPTARVTVMVDDPSNVSNGFALPFLEGPVIFLWPTPPTPSPTFGAHRGWGEVLAVHEYGHIAHLTIPSRNPNERRLWRFLPTQIGPVARKSPAWVIEGYATLIEGMLTGNGRPYSVGRAAVLREWALEGKLPTYGQLDNAGPFFGGSMRYLVGSAYLEWLQARKGDSSLVSLWRRMSARQQRTFGAAFVGVFGAPPEDLYGKFFVEVTAKSLEIQRQLTAAGLIEGELVQKLNWGTGDPAVSSDGKLLAVTVRSPGVPARLLVWNADEDRNDTTRARQRERLLRRDPLDVPAIDSFPPPRRPVATLAAAAGRSYDFPRWLADTTHLLVSRDAPLGEGTTRPDLFLWNYKTGSVRRVTRGAGIRSADPSPDGKSAVAVRCADGFCGLVIVDLATGAWRTLAKGDGEVVWHRPRWSPDGARIAAACQRNGRWMVAIVDPATGATRILDQNDGASRYAPSWTANGGALVVVSERGGVANLERVDLEGDGATVLTRVVSSVAAPEVSRSDGLVYFLALHAKGYDLRRVSLDSAVGAAIVSLDPALAPAAPRRAERQPGAFDRQAPPAAHAYGIGPRRWRILPGALFGADGAVGTLMVANIDPIVRLDALAQGGYGERGTWRGGSLSATLRRFAADIEASVWYVERHPGSAEHASLAAPSGVELVGAGLLGQFAREQTRTAYVFRWGGSAGRPIGPGLDAAGRGIVFGEARARATLMSGDRTLVATGSVLSTVGQTSSEAWTRSIVAAEVIAGQRPLTVRATATWGTVTAAAPGEFGRRFEQFVIGGSEVPFLDRAFLSQHVPLPGVPAGFLQGRHLGVLRLGLRGLTYEPFVTWVAAGDELEDWKRVLGLEQAFSSPALGFVKLPEVRARVGVSYSIDEPYRHRPRAYASLTYRP